MRPVVIARYVITAAALALVGFLIFTTFQQGRPSAVACTMEAKICPDGSAVGREGPSCEFAACPNGDAQFSEEGTMVFNDPMQPVGPGSLVYIKDGQTYTKNLALDIESMCVGGGTSVSCMALSSSPDVRYAGKRVRVTGIDRGADLLVRSIEIITTSSTSTPQPQKATVIARIGQKVSAMGVSITPHEIVEDSRCPQGVQCVWAGTVKVRSTLEGGMGVSPVTFEIGFPISTEAEFITLTQVSPYPTAGTPTNPDTYRFTFEISKRPPMQ
jgi:hypothetical protein